MKVSEIIEKLKELPQDMELPINEVVKTISNKDFNSGLMIGMIIMGMSTTRNYEWHSFDPYQQPTKNRLSNIHGDYEKYIGTVIKVD